VTDALPGGPVGQSIVDRTFVREEPLERGPVQTREKDCYEQQQLPPQPRGLATRASDIN
jgi:hypothetical protein